ncbi:MAG: discoidin domain-containing protein [Thiobacillus sp.]|nr:discoidin domain-containing protein [Thiobacillus sp.]
MLNLTELIGFGVGGGDAHLYWRLRLTAGSGAFFTMYEVEFRASAGGVDQCSGGTAFASYSNPSYPPANAFDNNGGSLWTTSRQLVGDYIGYQFAAPVSVQQAGYTSYGVGPCDGLILEYSDDGTTYTPYGEWTGLADTFVSGAINLLTV